MHDDPVAAAADAARRRLEGLAPAERSRLIAQASSVPASLDDDAYPAWDGQAAQYPESGPPGVSYLLAEPAPGAVVNCLLHRDDSGRLDGILNHYPAGVAGEQQPGTINIWVRPDRQGRGIGTRLVLSAWAQGWHIDPDAATASGPGGRLAERAMRAVLGDAERDGSA